MTLSDLYLQSEPHAYTTNNLIWWDIKDYFVAMIFFLRCPPRWPNGDVEKLSICDYWEESNICIEVQTGICNYLLDIHFCLWSPA